jgi:hypothetical protein
MEDFPNEEEEKSQQPIVKQESRYGLCCKYCCWLTAIMVLFAVLVALLSSYNFFSTGTIPDINTTLKVGIYPKNCD